MLPYPPFFAGHGLPRGGLKQWWAADLSVVKDGSNKVTAWNDLSGNGNHWVPADGATALDWVDAQLNGKPVVRCTNAGASNRFLNCTSFLTDASNQSAELFLVLKTTRINGADNVGPCAYGKYKPSGLAYQCYQDGGSKLDEQFGRASSFVTTPGTVAAARNYNMYRVRVTTSSYDMWVGAALVFTFSGVVAVGWNQGGATNDKFYLFTDEATDCFRGDIVEGLVYAPVCTNPSAVLSYFTAKYGVAT